MAEGGQPEGPEPRRHGEAEGGQPEGPEPRRHGEAEGGPEPQSEADGGEGGGEGGHERGGGGGWAVAPPPPADEAADGWPDRLARLQGERLFSAIGVVFLLALLFYYLEPVVRALLIGFVGAILAVVFNMAVRRLPVARGRATAIVALATLGALVASVWLTVTFLVGQIQGLLADLPDVVELLEGWEDALEARFGVEIELVGVHGQRVVERLVGGIDGRAILTGALGVIEVLALVFLVLIGAFFLVAKPNEQLLLPLMRAVPRRHHPTARRLFARMGERLGGWLTGTLLTMVAVGVMAAVAFPLLGIPYAMLLAVVMAVTNVIPLIGPFIGGALAVLVALLYDPGLALWVALSVLVIQEIESNLVRPFVMSSAAQLHPFVTLMALILFGSMFGLLGAILSLPVVLAVGTAVEVLWVEARLGAGDDVIDPVVEE